MGSRRWLIISASRLELGGRAPVTPTMSSTAALRELRNAIWLQEPFWAGRRSRFADCSVRRSPIPSRGGKGPYRPLSPRETSLLRVAPVRCGTVGITRRGSQRLSADHCTSSRTDPNPQTEPYEGHTGLLRESYTSPTGFLHPYSAACRAAGLFGWLVQFA